MGELGERLRRAREEKGLTLEELEEITRIRRRYLQALEEEDYGQLPGDVFVRGFLRNYALTLGLDPQEILAASGRKPAPPIVPQSEEREPFLDEPLTPPSTMERVMPVLIGVMIVGVVAFGAWTIYRYLGPGSAKPPAPTPAPTETIAQAMAQATATVTVQPTAAATATPTPTETPEPSVTPVSGVILRLQATQKAWLRVTVDDRLAYEGNLEEGQTREWQGTTRIDLRCGNAGGVRIWFNGQEQQSLGEPGEIVERSWGAAPLPEESGAAPTAEATPGPVGMPPVMESPTATAGPPTLTPTPQPAE